MGSDEFAASADSTAQLRVKRPTRPIGNSAERPADDRDKDYEGSGTEIVNASPAAVLNSMT
jgi:hypothetical protein